MCGIFGVYNVEEASKLAYLGLYALQHRGQESAGIASSDGSKVYSYVKMGLVADNFTPDVFDKIPGRAAIGHCRYSTTGTSSIKNAQPLTVSYSRGQLAMAHNGNLVNADMVRAELEANGAIFSSTTDTEVIVHLLAHSKKNGFREMLIDALKRVKGAFSLVVLTENELVGVVDPWNFRPLNLGKKDGGYVLASETCAFDIIDAEYIRPLEPGEMVIISEKGVESFKPFKPAKQKKCIFEFIYFSRPDSYIFGQSVQKARKALGAELAKENIVKADYVIPVPDSANSSATGYARESNIPYEMGIIRNHYIGRTFIEPSQSIRDFGAKIKYNPVKEILNGKDLVVIDDSIVRGTTSRKLVKMLRRVGAKDINWRISSPPITHPCFYGVDTATRAELIAASHTVEEIKKYLKVESLSYLSIDGLVKAVGGKKEDYCLACFCGEYPVEFNAEPEKMGFEG
ncbi:MAG: amidophosphoribosyltransferase [Candidatus Firestonebacteria bacterium RIFOXYA2_FULL_40_8]|nr:MAG: amidophosphoribosyltransferase [Candidatus Firestonebacteria bacterium RIFOXYA2_FULL_40_8]